MDTQILSAPVAEQAVVRSAAAPKVSGCARAVLAGGASIAIGILWDISWHRTIGRDTFWTPGHIRVFFRGLLGGIACEINRHVRRSPERVASNGSMRRDVPQNDDGDTSEEQ